MPRRRVPAGLCRIVALGALFSALAGVAGAGAQSARFVDALLAENPATLAATSYLVLAAAGQVAESVSTADAFRALQSKAWGFGREKADGPVTLGKLSLLIMRSFDVPGGLFYRLFPGPRYAARELAYLGLIDGDTSPNRLVSGEEAMRLLGRFLEWHEARSAAGRPGR